MAELEGVYANFARADADGTSHRSGPDLPVADGPASGSFGDSVDDAVRLSRGGEYLDFEFGHKVDRVLGAPVDLGVPTGPASALPNIVELLTQSGSGGGHNDHLVDPFG